MSGRETVSSPSGWTYRAAQENGDDVDCRACGRALDDDLPIVNDSEGYALHDYCAAPDVPEGEAVSGRMARCSCGNQEPTDPNPERLFGLVRRGEGSRDATELCGSCGYHRDAHEPRRAGPIYSTAARVCDSFVAHGPFEFDSFYCGHRGWD